MKSENVSTADKKPQVYTDEKGKKRVRMVKVDKEIVRANEGRASSSKNKRVLSIIGTAQNLDQAIKMVMKSHNTDEKKAKSLVHRAIRSEFYGESKDATLEACWDGYKQVGMKKKGEKMVPDCVPETKESSCTSDDEAKKVKKKQNFLDRLRGKPPVKEGYIGAKGEKGRDYHNAGEFDKDTAYSHAKKHNGVVHKDPSGKYLVKHGRGKHVSEESTEEETKYVVKYTHATDKKSGRTSGPLSKKAADKKAKMGNRVDKVGGKYTVIPHVEAYRKPTQAEIDADRKKDQKGKARPSLSYKSVTKKLYKNMRNEGEEVQELNKSTLKRYSAKASADAANSARAADRGDPEAASRQDKRVRGVKLATKKLKELSPDTIKRYRDKAKDSKDSHKRIAHDYSTRTGDSKSDWTDKMAKVHSRSADNRSKGIARANKRIGEAIKLSPAQQAKVDARKAARDADGRSSVARKAKKANPAASKPAPKAVPPEKKRGPQDKADLHPVMQLRKVVDTGGKHKPVFHRGKTGSVSADDAHHALKLYSKLPAMGKRQLQIRISKGGPDAVKKAADAHRSMSKGK